MSLKYLLHFCLLLTLVFSGCTVDRSSSAWPEPRPLGRSFDTYRPSSEPVTTRSDSPQIQEPTGVLTLRQALSLALLNNPELTVFSWEARAGDARSLQAGLLPNPEFEIETEEWGGTRNRKNFDGAETSIRLSQLIELAGKRGKRVRVAALERNVAGWDYESKRLDVFTQTAKAFIEVLTAQNKIEVSQEMLRLATQVLETVAERVETGKVSPLEESKAKVALATSRIEHERSKRELKAARKKLSAMWGSDLPLYARVEGNFESIRQIPSIENLLSYITQNPDLARWQTEIELREAAIELEDARGVPDFTISAGMQRFNETNDNAFVLGFSIPFPIFNHNQGAKLEARYGLSKALAEERAAVIKIRTDLGQIYQELSSAYLEVTSLKNDVVPSAQLAFDASSEGYLQGKFGYLEVLDAQRTLFQARGQYILALSAYHKAVAEVERLIGQRLEDTTSGNSISEEFSDDK